MKLIEKKCPNCGGSLEFSETDKSCKCDYCHRAFEIERDEKLDVSDIAEQFNLSELEEPLKAVSKVFIGSHIIFTAIAFIVFVIIFGMVIYGFVSHKDDFDTFYEGSESETVNKTIATNVSDFSNTTLKEFANDSYGELDVKGESSNNYSYQIEDHEVYKYVLAYKDNTNYLFVVQKVLYINFFNANDKSTVYIPVKYEDVTTELDEFDDDSEEILNSKKVDAPTYYLNKTKSSYVRGGYADYNKFVTEKIDPLKEQGYKITEK